MQSIKGQNQFLQLDAYPGGTSMVWESGNLQGLAAPDCERGNGQLHGVPLRPSCPACSFSFCPHAQSKLTHEWASSHPQLGTNLKIKRQKVRLLFGDCALWQALGAWWSKGKLIRTWVKPFIQGNLSTHDGSQCFAFLLHRPVIHGNLPIERIWKSAWFVLQSPLVGAKNPPEPSDYHFAIVQERQLEFMKAQERLPCWQIRSLSLLLWYLMTHFNRTPPRRSCTRKVPPFWWCCKDFWKARGRRLSRWILQRISLWNCTIVAAMKLEQTKAYSKFIA